MFFVGIAVLLVGIVATWIAIIRGQGIQAAKPGKIHDIVHENVPFDSAPEPLRRLLYWTKELIPALLIAYTTWGAYKSGQLSAFASSVLLIIGATILVRSITFSATILPPIQANFEGCRKVELSQPMSIFDSCVDYIFSGHTAVTLATGLVAAKYGIVSTPVAYAVATTVGALMAITKIHYTVDVVMALFVPPVLINTLL